MCRTCVKHHASAVPADGPVGDGPVVFRGVRTAVKPAGRVGRAVAQVVKLFENNQEFVTRSASSPRLMLQGLRFLPLARDLFGCAGLDTVYLPQEPNTSGLKVQRGTGRTTCTPGEVPYRLERARVDTKQSIGNRFRVSSKVLAPGQRESGRHTVLSGARVGRAR